MEGKDIASWNVFLPRHILLSSPGYLFGKSYACHNMVCVHGVAPGKPKPGSLDTIGCYEVDARDQKRYKQPCLSNVWLNLKSDKQNSIVCCDLKVKSSTDGMVISSVVCVVYDPVELGSSYVFLHSMQGWCCDSVEQLSSSAKSKQIIGAMNTMSQFKHSDNTKSVKDSLSEGTGSHCSTAETLCESVNTLVTLAEDVHIQQAGNGNKARLKFSLSRWMSHWFQQIFQSLLILPILVACYTGALVSAGLKLLHRCCAPFPHMLQVPSTLQHLQTRGFRYRTALGLDRTDKFNRFLLFNCCGQQLVDTLLGVSLIWIIMHFGLASLVASHILDWADIENYVINQDVAQELVTLVEWLMGAPAGLKLNTQLTEFLGHFFIYHIHLWTGYLGLLRSIMPSVLLVCSSLGVLGLSVQMCLVQDVLSMLTLHIYCFYVYAAKIFHLQVYALRSLWRLFRGKKWNVLRERVDSASYNTDQLFVGTLLFTILLFLLPTTALYYSVFTLLRLLELTVQGILSRIVNFISSMPVFTLVLRLMAPRLVAGSVFFKVLDATQGENCLILNMQTCQIPFHQLTKLTKSLLSSKATTVHTLGEFISNLATGGLIYPWVDPKSETKQKTV